MKIIPAIDIIEGKCVRLTRGDYSRKEVYSEDPLEVALRFEDAGLGRLHLVDLDGARAGHIIHHKVLERICSKTKLMVDFGGGLKSSEDARVAFECGAAQITGGSIAVKDRDTFLSWLKRYGPDRIILGADAMNEKVAVSGWQEGTDLDLFAFLESYIAEGIRYVICTDIDKDGMLEGPATELYRRILEKFPDMRLIASGGVAGVNDVEALAELPLEGVIIGKAIYEGRISLQELTVF